MFGLLSYLKPYKKALVMGPLLLMVGVAGELFQPILLARIIDEGIAYGDMTVVIRTGLLMIGLSFLGIVGGIGSTYFSSVASQSFGADIRAAVFKKVQSFSFSNLDEFKTASLITRLTNDITQVQMIVLMGMRMLVRAPVLCIGAIVMAVSINLKLSLIFVVAMPLLIAVTFFINRKAVARFTLVQSKVDNLNGIVRENMAGVRVIKAFVRGAQENKRFGEANDDLKTVNEKATRLVAVTMPAIMMIMNLSLVAVLWFGGIQVNAGNLRVGQIAAFINYLTQILMSLMMISMIFMMLARSKVSADRVNEVLQAEIDLTDLPDADDRPISAGRVVFKNVDFQYHGTSRDPVLKQINLKAEPGQTIAILGGTGSGKTTLVNLIPRLYDVTAGQLLVDGRDVREMKTKTLRQSIGVVLQESVLFSGTIKENLLWGNEEASDKEVETAAKSAQAHEFIMSAPNGYDTVLDQGGVNLSGGQKQRLAIARALIKQPKILILDDSTSAVDLSTESRIKAALRKMKETTIFLVAQRISSVMDADKIIVLDDGQIVAEGTHEKLLKTNPVYQEIYRSQFGEEAVG